MVKFMGLGLIIFLPLWIISIWQLDKAGFGKRMVGLVSSLTVILIVLFPFLMTRRGLVDTVAVNLILIAAAGLLFLVARSWFEEEKYRGLEGEGGEQEEFIVSKLLKQAGFTANPDEIAVQGAAVQTSVYENPKSAEQLAAEAGRQTFTETVAQAKPAPVLEQEEFAPYDETLELDQVDQLEEDDLGKLLAALDEEETRRESAASGELDDTGGYRAEEIEPGVTSREEIEIKDVEDFEFEEDYVAEQEAETVELILEEETLEEEAVEELIDKEQGLEEEPAQEAVEAEKGIVEEVQAVMADEEIEELTAEIEAAEEEAAIEAEVEEAKAVPAKEESKEAAAETGAAEEEAAVEAEVEEVQAVMADEEIEELTAETEAAEEEAAVEEAAGEELEAEGVGEVRAEDIEEPPVAPVAQAEARDEEEESEEDEERKERIAHYIDIGFEAKEQGDAKQAILEFLRALDAGPEPQLILLLGIEVSQLYAQQGNYDDAIGILERIKPEICKEKRVRVERELNYLQALKKLLDQAGLSGMPAPRVPRFYKMRAEEIARSK